MTAIPVVLSFCQIRIALSSEIVIQLVNNVDGGLFEDLLLVVEDEGFLYPANPFHRSHVLNHAALLLADRNHRLPQLVISDKSRGQFFHTLRPHVNVIELYVFVFLLRVHHPDRLLQLTLD